MNLFITHDMLVNRAKKWLIAYKMPIVLTEYHSYSTEIPDAIGISGRQSIVIECKVSRSDFLGDKKKNNRNHKRALGNYRYYLTPPNILCPEDIPEDWGLLYVMDKRVIKAKIAPPHFDIEVKAEEWLLLYSLCRRVVGHNLLDKILEVY